MGTFFHTLIILNLFMFVSAQRYFYFQFSQNGEYLMELRTREKSLICSILHSLLVACLTGISCIGIVHKLQGIKISRLFILSYVHEKLFASIYYVSTKTLS